MRFLSLSEVAKSCEYLLCPVTSILYFSCSVKNNEQTVVIFWPNYSIIFNHCNTKWVMVTHLFFDTKTLSFCGFPYIFVFVISSYHG